MGELKVGHMAHLGFHRHAHKDKDKEKEQEPADPPQAAADRLRQHEKLQTEFRDMVPATPVLTGAAGASGQRSPDRLSPLGSPISPHSQSESPGLSRTTSAGSHVNAQLPPLVKDDGSCTPLARTPSGAQAGAHGVPACVPYRGEHQPSGVLVHTAGTAKPPRLEVYDVGQERLQHWHHLRPARRQEKLTRIVRDFFKREQHHDAEGVAHDQTPLDSRSSSPVPGAPLQVTDSLERDREAAEAVALASKGKQPPSLLADLEAQMRESSNSDPADVLNRLLNQRRVTDASLVQRYGQLSSVVGKGSFGVVRLAQKADPENKRRKLMYAVKEFHPNSGESESHFMKRLASEFCLASLLDHPNIVKTLDLLRDSRNKFCGVMEYCAGGDLYSLIVVAGKLEPIEADCFFKQVMRGVAYMHESGIAHRDLKPENVLLTSRGCCKITDFGNAERFRMPWEKGVIMSTALAGSGPYIAPEEYKKSNFDPRPVDVWAAGVIYMAMSTGRHLWREAKPSDEFYEKYLAGRKDEKGYEPIERLKTAKRRNVIYSVLDPVASRRLTARQVLNSEWGREISVCEAGEGDHSRPEAPHSPNQPA